jgi:hypothetical protein
MTWRWCLRGKGISDTETRRSTKSTKIHEQHEDPRTARRSTKVQFFVDLQNLRGPSCFVLLAVGSVFQAKVRSQRAYEFSVFRISIDAIARRDDDFLVGEKRQLVAGPVLSESSLYPEASKTVDRCDRLCVGRQLLIPNHLLPYMNCQNRANDHQSYGLAMLRQRQGSRRPCHRQTRILGDQISI